MVQTAFDLILDLAKANKAQIRKAAIVGDNTAASVFFFKPLREKLLKAKGIEVVVDEVWTPPLADATAIVQKLRSTQPDIMFYGATNFPDSLQVLQKIKEFGVKTPIQGVGAWLVTPEYVKTVGKELLDNVMSVVAAHPLKGQEELVKRFIARHFYRTKYDYREQWLRFTQRLGSLVSLEQLGPVLVSGVTDAAGAARGALYLVGARDGRYHLAGTVELQGIPAVLEPSAPIPARLARETAPVSLTGALRETPPGMLLAEGAVVVPTLTTVAVTSSPAAVLMAAAMPFRLSEPARMSTL